MPPLTARSALTTWQFAPLVSSILILLAACYLLGVYRVGRRHPARPWPAGRTLTFSAGPVRRQVPGLAGARRRRAGVTAGPSRSAGGSSRPSPG